MILGFKRYFPWGSETWFCDKIINSFPWEPGETACRLGIPAKHHSIRKGNRWKPEMIIHFAYGQRTKNYWCFRIGKVKTTQRINIYSDVREVWVATRGAGPFYSWSFKKLSKKKVEELAINDGFDSVEDFWKWFKVDVSGQIISWTGKLYLV